MNYDAGHGGLISSLRYHDCQSESNADTMMLLSPADAVVVLKH